MRIGWGLFGGVFVASWWAAPYPHEQALHHSLTAMAVGLLLWARRRFALADSSVGLVLIFLALHTVAARWIYSYVPYDDWAQALFGFRVNEVMGWERNHFDRLVHLAYGLCFAPVVMAAARVRPLRAVEVVVSTSALYELFEWAIAVLLSPAAAEAYNGQQGDLWDAHRDIALATLGALAGVAVAEYRRRRARPEDNAPPITESVRTAHER